MDKTDFFHNLSNQIANPIYLTDRIDEVYKEIEFNCWELGIPNEVLAETTERELLEFIETVKINYQTQLNKSDLNIDLIFYLWIDEIAGQIRFNFINVNHQKLPFNCQLDFAENAQEIVGIYFKSNSLNEFKTIETSEDNFILTVYKEIIKKSSSTL